MAINIEVNVDTQRRIRRLHRLWLVRETRLRRKIRREKALARLGSEDSQQIIEAKNSAEYKAPRQDPRHRPEYYGNIDSSRVFSWDDDLCHAQVEKICRSDLFKDSIFLVNLLRYLHKATCDGVDVYEKTIAQDILGISQHAFIERQPSDARVLLNRLRKNLELYNKEIGYDDAFIIEIPNRQFKLKYIRTHKLCITSKPQLSSQRSHDTFETLIHEIANEEAEEEGLALHEKWWLTLKPEWVISVSWLRGDLSIILLSDTNGRIVARNLWTQLCVDLAEHPILPNDVIVFLQYATEHTELNASGALPIGMLARFINRKEPVYMALNDEYISFEYTANLSAPRTLLPNM